MAADNPMLVQELDDHNNVAGRPPGREGGDGRAEEEDNPFLDALIQELDLPDHDPPNDVPGGDDDETQEARNNLARAILSSASARKKIRKPDHCQFCNSFLDVMTLRAHLEEKEDCFNLYRRMLHLKTIDAILSSLFTCLYCQTTDAQLASHLKSHNQCFQRYCQKLNVTSISEISAKVKNLKRQGYKSRRSLKRSFENADYKGNKRLKLQNEPPEYFLNRHIQDTAFGNIKKCSRCFSNSGSAIELKQDHEYFQTSDVQFSDLLGCRRMGKVWICQNCLKSKNATTNSEHSMFRIKRRFDEQKEEFVYFPSLNYEENGAEDFYGTGPNVNDKFAFPTTVESLDSFGDNQNIQLKTLSSWQAQQMLYSGKEVSFEDVAKVYENQLRKYKQVKEAGEFYSARIVDKEAKIISHVKQCTLDNRIVGSSAYKSSKNIEVQKKMVQFGSNSLFLEVSVPCSSSIEATSLVNEGKVITISYEGSESQELGKKYHVHLGHGPDTDCRGRECVTQDLEDFIEQETKISNKNVTTYIAFVDQFCNSFIKNIVRCPSSDFFAERYHFEVRFDKMGLCKMTGVIWPLKFEKMNTIDIDPSLSEEEVKQIKKDFLDILEKNISTSSSNLFLMDHFKLSDVETMKILKLVEENQVHVCLNCPGCQNVSLPSFETFLPEAREESINFEPCQNILKAFKILLLSLTVEDIRTLNTTEWIENIWENSIQSHELIDLQHWEITIMEQGTFTFELEEDLVNMITKYQNCPLIAVYQFALMMTSRSSCSRVVIKQQKLIECFTSPYEPLFIKAAAGPMKLHLMRAPGDWNALNKCEFLMFEKGDTGIIGHEEVTLTEALSLSDSMKFRVKTSFSTEFVNSRPETNSTFKKVNAKIGDCYRTTDDGAFYQIQENFLSRYFKRVNGRDLLLCEFCIYYDFCGELESENLYKVYEDKVDLIEQSDKCSVITKDPLPELVLLNNRDVMRKRKQPKVLRYPEFDPESYEYRYSQVLLFSMIESYEGLSQATVEEQFSEVDDDGAQKVKVNKRKFLLNVRLSS